MVSFRADLRAATDGRSRVSGLVAIVIVSHAPDVARSVAAFVEETVRGAVSVAWSGGTADGALGTNVSSIVAAINAVLTPKGVAVLVDLGGAETNAESAIDLLADADRAVVRVCDAPLVEGAIVAAARAAAGADLSDVCRAAEEAGR